MKIRPGVIGAAGWSGELPFIGLLFLIVGWRYAPLVTGEVYKTLHPDALYLYMPVFSQISRIFSAGDYPYWLSTHLCGIPLYNATHFTILYPFYFFDWGLYQTPLDCVVQINRVIGFHLLLLGFNAYFMLRTFGLGRFAALAGAGITACGATVIVLASWVNIIAPLSWIPLALAGAHLILETPRKSRGIALTAPALAMICLASPAQELIYAFYLIAGMCLFKGIELIQGRSPVEAGRIAAALLLTGVIAFGLVAPVAVSILTDMPGMIRFAGAHQPVIGHESLPVQAILEGQIAPLDLLKGLIRPSNRPPVTGDPYLGLIPIVLICFAFQKGRAAWLRPFFFFAVYGLYSATGEHLGAAAVNQHLPLLNKIREADRHLVFTAISAPVLAAWGLEYLTAILAKTALPSFLKRNGVVAAALFLAALFFPGVNDPLWAAFPLDRDSCLGVDLYAAAKNQESISILSRLGEITDKDEYRFGYHTRGLAPVFWAMNGAYFGLRGFESFFQPLPLRQFSELAGKTNSLRYFQLLGGRYWLWEKGDDPPPTEFVLLESFGNVELLAANNASPRCFLTDGPIDSYSNADDFLQRLEAGAQASRPLYIEAAQFEAVKARLVRERHIEPVFSVTAFLRKPNTYGFRVACNKPAFLVFNEYHGPNWHARVDGKPSRTLKANLNQIGLLLDAGNHQVEFEYSPRLFCRLLPVSRAVWMMGMLWIAIMSFRRKW